MVPLQTFFWLLFTTIQTQAINDVCIWDRKSTKAQSYQHNHVNGEYLYDGLHDSQPSWIKTQHSNCGPTLYLYHHQYDFWAIGASKAGDSYIARCAEPNATLCVAGKWNLNPSGRWWPDDNMRLISGNCPNLDCKTITTTSLDNKCTSFTQQIASNAWKASNGFVWYFSTVSFCWLCIDSANYEYNDCDAVYQLKTSWNEMSSWNNMSSDDSMSLDIEATQEDQQTLSVTCNGKGSAPPQPIPTPQPTSFKPTLNPILPTADPTSSPVLNPSSPTKKEDNEDNNGSEDEEEEFSMSDLTDISSWEWWMYVAAIAIVLCLCVVIILCVMKAKKKKGYIEAEEEEVTDRVEMNSAQSGDTPNTGIVVPTSVYNPYGAPVPDVYRAGQQATNYGQTGSRQQNMYDQNRM